MGPGVGPVGESRVHPGGRFRGGSRGGSGEGPGVCQGRVRGGSSVVGTGEGPGVCQGWVHGWVQGQVRGESSVGSVGGSRGGSRVGSKVLSRVDSGPRIHKPALDPRWAQVQDSEVAPGRDKVHDTKGRWTLVG